MEDFFLCFFCFCRRIIENPSFYSHLTGRENMAIVTEMKRLKYSQGLEALEKVGLEYHIDKVTAKYSLGMKQRLGIAIAIVGNPKLLILDEPTNGLDLVGKEEMRKLIQDFSKTRKATVLISSHILDELEKMVTDIGIIHRGKILFDGNLDNFKKSHGGYIEMKTSDDVKAYAALRRREISCEYSREKKLVLKYVDNDKIAKCVAWLIQEHIRIYRITEEKRTLEELFLQMTGKGTL